MICPTVLNKSWMIATTVAPPYYKGTGENMNAKMIAIIAVAVVVVAGAAVAIVVINNNNKGDNDELAYFNEAGLKVMGNADNDNDIDMDDYNAVKQLIDDKKSASDNKMADANNDGTLDDKDLEVIDKVIKKEKVTVWHINYHDTDSNGTMDKELVSTTIPVTSTLMTGSANNFMMFTLLGIEPGTVVKGACYGTSNDKFLYDKSGNKFLDTDTVKKVGSKSYEILFESGKDDGASELVKTAAVTCVVSDWNRTYIENEAAFESAGVDVVRISAASFEKDVYTHSITLLGLVFSVQEQATKILGLYDNVYDEIKEVTSQLTKDTTKKAVASSMDGAISSEDSDYTAVIVAAGAEYGLKGFDMGGSTLAYVSDNLGIFDTREYQFDNIVHIRTALTYGSTETEVAKYWSTYANAMALWEHAYDGQLLISGSIPVPCRVAYAAYAIYGDSFTDLSEAWALSILTQFENEYNGVDMSRAHNSKLVLDSYMYTVTVSDEVTVKDKNNNVVASGTAFPYGTELSIEAKVVDPDKTLVASGGSVKDGKFFVVDNINAKYVKNSELAILSKAASTLVSLYQGNIYMQTGEANATDIGSVSLTSTSSSGTKTTVLGFKYYDTVADAYAAYDASKTTASGKSGNVLDTSAIVGSTADNGIYIKFTANVSTGKAYNGYSTIYMTAYYKNVVWEYTTYFSHYVYDESFSSKTPDQAKAYFQAEATKLAQAFEDAMIAAYTA